MLYTGLLFGFMSSLHCIGMCGPIALMLPIKRDKTLDKLAKIFLYHLGRLTAYGGIGFIFGLVGKGLYLAGLQQKISVVIGICMIIGVFIPEKNSVKSTFLKLLHQLMAPIKNQLGQQFKSKKNSSFYKIGLFNGFLPCGLVYVALFGAMAMQNEFFGGLYMVLFGIGTIPLMSTIVLLHDFLNLSSRNAVQKIIPYLVILLGVVFILRGLGLGIPYVSPSNLSLFVQSSPNCHG